MKDLENATPLLGSPNSPTDLPSGTLPLLFSILAAIGAFLFGWTLGFSGPALPPMENSNSGISSPFACTDYHDDDDEKDGENYGLCNTSPQGDLFGSIVNLGCLLGAFVGGYFMDKLGRKRTMCLASLPFAVGFSWIGLTSLASDSNKTIYAQLIAGRMLTGLAVGIVSCTVPVYIAEVAPSHLRGSLGCINQLAITLGIFAGESLFLGDRARKRREVEIRHTWARMRTRQHFIAFAMHF